MNRVDPKSQVIQQLEIYVEQYPKFAKTAEKIKAYLEDGSKLKEASRSLYDYLVPLSVWAKIKGHDFDAECEGREEIFTPSDRLRESIDQFVSTILRNKTIISSIGALQESARSISNPGCFYMLCGLLFFSE